MSETPSPVAGLARSAASQPFWDGLAAGELRLPRCSACDRLFFYPRPFCPRCWSDDVTWVRASGGGTVWAVTTVHVAFDPSFDVPYVVAIVELDEGVRIPARIDGGDGEVGVGERVAIRFPAAPGDELPTFGRRSGGLTGG